MYEKKVLIRIEIPFRHVGINVLKLGLTVDIVYVVLVLSIHIRGSCGTILANPDNKVPQLLRVWSLNTCVPAAYDRLFATTYCLLDVLKLIII